MITFCQLNIGWLSRNRYWGESDERALRPARCSSVLIRGAFGNILVDPCCPRDEMDELLFRRRGIRAGDINHIFLTHLHGDHTVGAQDYPGAQLYCHAREAEGATAPLKDLLTPVDVSPFEGIALIPLPGHTLGTAGLGFASGRERVLVAGDAAMTLDFFEHEMGYFNTVDFGLAADSIRRIRREFTLVIPGHDVQFPLRAQ